MYVYIGWKRVIAIVVRKNERDSESLDALKGSVCLVQISNPNKYRWANFYYIPYTTCTIRYSIDKVSRSNHDLYNITVIIRKIEENVTHFPCRRLHKHTKKGNYLNSSPCCYFYNCFAFFKENTFNV